MLWYISHSDSAGKHSMRISKIGQQEVSGRSIEVASSGSSCYPIGQFEVPDECSINLSSFFSIIFRPKP